MKNYIKIIFVLMSILSVSCKPRQNDSSVQSISREESRDSAIFRNESRGSAIEIGEINFNKISQTSNWHMFDGDFRAEVKMKLEEELKKSTFINESEDFGEVTATAKHSRYKMVLEVNEMSEVFDHLAGQQVCTVALTLRILEYKGGVEYESIPVAEKYEKTSSYSMGMRKRSKEYGIDKLKCIVNATLAVAETAYQDISKNQIK